MFREKKTNNVTRQWIIYNSLVLNNSRDERAPSAVFFQMPFLILIFSTLGDPVLDRDL